MAGLATAHDKISTRAIAETADEMYVKNLLKASVDENVNFEKFFKLLREKQKDIALDGQDGKEDSSKDKPTSTVTPTTPTNKLSKKEKKKLKEKQRKERKRQREL